MHILSEILRSDAHRMSQYASAPLLKSQTDCTIVRVSRRKLFAGILSSNNNYKSQSKAA